MHRSNCANCIEISFAWIKGKGDSMELFGYRAIAEAVALFVVAVGGFKAKSFRRDNPGSSGCKTQIVKDVTETKTRVGILEKNQTVLFKKVDGIADDVSFIRGRME